MSAGLKKRISQWMDGISIQDAFGVPAATMENVENAAWLSGEGKDKVILWYVGTSAITEADFINLPKGSIIVDHQAGKIKLKTTAPGTATFIDVALT